MRADMHQRFARIDERFVGIDQRVLGNDRRFLGIEQRFDRLDANVDRTFLSTMGVMTTGFITVIGAIITLSGR
jgi:hypothetical protein